MIKSASTSIVIRKSPALQPRHLVGRCRRHRGVPAVLNRQIVERMLLYGSCKAALRDVLRLMAPVAESNILLPAYVPDGVVEPIRETGVEPRFYTIKHDLSPDFANLKSQIDEQTVAVVVVHYFGFPQRKTDVLRKITDEYGCYLIDDNAHAALSEDDEGQLLGTLGDVGFTSFRKLFPVPDGAALFITNPDLAARMGGTRLAGCRTSLNREDYRFVIQSLLNRARQKYAAVDRLLDLGSRTNQVGKKSGGTTPKRNPAAIYRRAKSPMSNLSKRVLTCVNTVTVTSNRRVAYRTWTAKLADWPGVEILFEQLPKGVCPQICPVIVANASDFIAALAEIGVKGVNTWPPLPEEVVGGGFETAGYLADHLVTLPTHQDVTPSAIREVCRFIDQTFN